MKAKRHEELARRGPALPVNPHGVEQQVNRHEAGQQINRHEAGQQMNCHEARQQRTFFMKETPALLTRMSSLGYFLFT